MKGRIRWYAFVVIVPLLLSAEQQMERDSATMSFREHKVLRQAVRLIKVASQKCCDPEYSSDSRSSQQVAEAGSRPKISKAVTGSRDHDCQFMSRKGNAKAKPAIDSAGDRFEAFRILVI